MVDAGEGVQGTLTPDLVRQVHYRSPRGSGRIVESSIISAATRCRNGRGILSTRVRKGSAGRWLGCGGRKASQLSWPCSSVIAELLGPEFERVGDQLGDVAGADLAAAELGIVEPAGARGADQCFDAVRAVGIAAVEPIENTSRTVVGSFSST